MSNNTGILAALYNKRSLEDKIEHQLNKVLGNQEITNRYTDRQDKQNALRRELILATLSTIIQHRNDKFMDDSGGATVQIENEPDPFSELTAAWRDLQHDTERLNDGMRGELIAAPVICESLEQKGVISADRKFRIMWYVAAELYTKKEDHLLFPSKTEFEKYAASILNSSSKSIKIERSKLKQSKNEIEKSLFYELINTARALSKESGGEITPFKIFLPALRALSNNTTSKYSRKVN